LVREDAPARGEEQVSDVPARAASEEGSAVAFLEAAGFVAAFDAAEAMTKAARVSLGGLVRVGGGLVSVSVLGDLAHLVEAIDVGEETIRARYGVEVRSVVFPNPTAAVGAIAREPGLIE
jgi:ethanolamine utilization protein EutM